MGMPRRYPAVRLLCARAASARSFVPVFDRAVAASKPSRGHEIDLLGPRQM